MKDKPTNMHLDWDLSTGRLIISFTYPNVNSRCIDEKNNIWRCSSSIVDDAIQDHLKGTKIRWTNSSSTSPLYSQILTLEITNYEKDLSFKKLNEILLNLNNQIKIGIYNLINTELLR